MQYAEYIQRYPVSRMKKGGDITLLLLVRTNNLLVFVISGCVPVNHIEQPHHHGNSASHTNYHTPENHILVHLITPLSQDLHEFPPAQAAVYLAAAGAGASTGATGAAGAAGASTCPPPNA